MDIRRTIIILGLAISSYFLILAYNGDYGQKPETAAIATISEEAALDVPDTSDAHQAQAEAPNPNNPLAVHAVEAKADNTNLIQVITDTLVVTINLRGGEVVAVKLPAYPASIDQPQVPFSLMDSSSERLYTAQSGLVGRDGLDKAGAALFTAEKSNFVLAQGQDELKVVLKAADAKTQVEKEFTFKRGDYLIGVNYKIQNTSTEPWQGVFYAQLKRDNSKDPSAGSQMGMAAYLGAALTTKDNRYEKVKFGDLEKGYKTVETGGWAAMLQHYFLSAWVPQDQEQQYTYNGRVFNGNNLFGFYSAPMVVAAGASQEVGANLYVGPKIQKRLEEVAPHLELTVDYGWLWWIAQPLFWLLTFFHSLVGNWGVAIILLTISIKLLFFKPSAMSYRSMANMRKVAPKMNAIKEQYGDNREKLGQEMMKLYKEEKINPLGGCLPILIQMPVFIALYWVLMESVELRQAPFILWIKDMSVMDPYFILPLIMGASMFFQMKLNPTPPDPMQARVMQFMPVIFTVFFLWFPSGVVLYWVVNNVLTMTQQYIITKQIENS
ncbi:MAG: membrane protein insertase YidC [Venatoribacter sp.]